MNDHALRVLEYGQIRDILASYAATPLGRALVAGLEPMHGLADLRVRLSEAAEMGELIKIARVPLSGFKDVAAAVRALAAGGRPAEPELLYDVLQLLRGSLALKEGLSRQPETFPSITRLAAGLADLPALRERIERAVDPREGIRDDCTEKLRLLRGEIRQLRESIRERIGRKLADPRLHKAFQSEGIKFKNDRYLLPVKADYRQWVAGVIRDRSHTGGTLYLEPEELVLDGDRLLDRIDDERAEVQRILWEFTRAVLAEENRLKENQHMIALADLAYAKACYAQAFGLSIPEIHDPREEGTFLLELRQARHPYLLWLNRDKRRDLRDPGLEEARSKVIPLDVRLGDPSRLLIITGPNTGGKTVVLKTIGLNLLMALSGMPIAAEPGSKTPLVSDLFADIGDEQSIEQSLSTFSAHLSQIVEILKAGDANALVLLDELGAGTDPLEGAALATALLDWFYRNGWKAIITTHLGSLKEFAFLHEAAENAAMLFDPETLKPTYHMALGIPGSSHALEIARRMGVNPEIAGAAEEKMREIQAPTQEVIEKMMSSHRQMEKERRRMQRLRQRAQGERRAAEADREGAAVERKAWRQEAELLADQAVRAARDKLLALLPKLQGVPKALQPVVEELRWTVELLLAGTPLGERREEFARSLKKEDEVYVPKFRERCKVRKVNKSERVVTVLLNGIPTEIAFDDISWLDGKNA